MSAWDEAALPHRDGELHVSARFQERCWDKRHCRPHQFRFEGVVKSKVGFSELSTLWSGSVTNGHQTGTIPSLLMTCRSMWDIRPAEVCMFFTEITLESSCK